MTWNNVVATWRGVTGRNISTQGVKLTCNPMFESVSNDFLPKEESFIFPIHFGKVAKLTWPWVTDIKILRYKFYRYWYGYQSLKVSRWSCIRCSYMMSIQTFSEVRSLDVTWGPDLVTWVWNFHMCGIDALKVDNDLFPLYWSWDNFSVEKLLI